MQTPLFAGRKLQGRTLMVARVSGRRLFFVIDRDTGTHFPVDIGAEVSIIPPSPNHRLKTVRNGIGNAISIPIQCNVVTLFCMNMIEYTIRMLIRMLG